MKNILSVGDKVNIIVGDKIVEEAISSIELVEVLVSNEQGIEVDAVPFIGLANAIIFYNDDNKWALGTQVWRTKDGS